MERSLAAITESTQNNSRGQMCRSLSSVFVIHALKTENECGLGKILRNLLYPVNMHNHISPPKDHRTHFYTVKFRLDWERCDEMNPKDYELPNNNKSSL